MWLIEFHIGFSILCFFAIIGLCFVGYDDMVKNGWQTNEKSSKIKVKDLLSFTKDLLSFTLAAFCPIVNLLMVLSVFYMMVHKKEDEPNENN